MKNKFLNKLQSAILAVVFATAEAACARPVVTAEMKTIITKFSLAMAGVIVFSIVISIGLALYNKFFVDKQIKDFKMNADSLRTPTDKDEAIMSFITRNKG